MLRLLRMLAPLCRARLERGARPSVSRSPAVTGRVGRERTPHTLTRTSRATPVLSISSTSSSTSPRRAVRDAGNGFARRRRLADPLHFRSWATHGQRARGVGDFPVAHDAARRLPGSPLDSSVVVALEGGVPEASESVHQQRGRHAVIVQVEAGADGRNAALPARGLRRPRAPARPRAVSLWCRRRPEVACDRRRSPSSAAPRPARATGACRSRRRSPAPGRRLRAVRVAALREARPVLHHGVGQRPLVRVQSRRGNRRVQPEEVLSSEACEAP